MRTPNKREKAALLGGPYSVYELPDLTAQLQSFDEAFIARYIFLFDIIQKTATQAHHSQKAAA